MTCGSTACTTRPIPVATGIDVPSCVSWLSDLLASLILMLEKRRQRRRLRELDQHLLDDIGLTREQAEEMAKRPFWR